MSLYYYESNCDLTGPLKGRQGSPRNPRAQFENHRSKRREVRWKVSFCSHPCLTWTSVLYPGACALWREEARVFWRSGGGGLCSHYLTRDSLPNVSGTYHANDWLDHLRNVVLLQTKEVRGLTVHSEAVGVIVVLHGADKASVPGHHIGQLRMKSRVRQKRQGPAILPGRHTQGLAVSLPVPSTLLTASCALNQTWVFAWTWKRILKEIHGPLRLYT